MDMPVLLIDFSTWGLRANHHHWTSSTGPPLELEKKKLTGHKLLSEVASFFLSFKDTVVVHSYPPHYSTIHHPSRRTSRFDDIIGSGYLDDFSF